MLIFDISKVKLDETGAAHVSGESQLRRQMFSCSTLACVAVGGRVGVMTPPAAMKKRAYRKPPKSDPCHTIIFRTEVGAGFVGATRIVSDHMYASLYICTVSSTLRSFMKMDSVEA